jgi:2-polyprenyl-3-methyl-5-hydroxy-6-metoxy-1,4-benzoquinol methylase
MYAETEQFGGDNPTSSVYRGERAASVLEYITTCLTSLMRVMGMDLQSSMSVLEVGAGLSWMCRAAKMMDWGHLTVAQDLSAETIEECRWVDHYLVEDLLSEQGVDQYGPYDVISMTHVFEHLADPVAMLRRLRGLLSERGIIFITAPSHPADWQRGADQEIWARWSYNHVPAHLQYFTSGSFAKAAEAAGLQVALWNSNCDGGEAFEGWLRHPSTG